AEDLELPVLGQVAGAVGGHVFFFLLSAAFGGSGGGRGSGTHGAPPPASWEFIRRGRVLVALGDDKKRMRLAGSGPNHEAFRPRFLDSMKAHRTRAILARSPRKEII